MLALDRFHTTGAILGDRRPGITGRLAAQGSLFVIRQQSASAPLVDALRTAVVDIADVYAGAADLPNRCGAWLRVMAADAIALRAAMTSAWQTLRKTLTGLTPAPRRK